MELQLSGKNLGYRNLASQLRIHHDIHATQFRICIIHPHCHMRVCVCVCLNLTRFSPTACKSMLRSCISLLNSSEIADTNVSVTVTSTVLGAITSGASTRTIRHVHFCLSTCLFLLRLICHSAQVPPWYRHACVRRLLQQEDHLDRSRAFESRSELHLVSLFGIVLHCSLSFSLSIGLILCGLSFRTQLRAISSFLGSLSMIAERRWCCSIRLIRSFFWIISRWKLRENPSCMLAGYSPDSCMVEFFFPFDTAVSLLHRT